MLTMDLGLTKWLFDKMGDRKFMLCYNGILSHELIRSLLAVAEKKLDREENDFLTRKKVFNVMIECLQAIYRAEESSESQSFFMLGKNQQAYELFSCMYVNDEQLKALTGLLEKVNSMDENDLRINHKQLLAESDSVLPGNLLFSFIDIALKSKNKIDHDFEKTSTLNFLILKTCILHSPVYA